jgi:hypothetical protein
MVRRCVDRPTLTAVATGRCPVRWLRNIRRHLPECPRCHSRVVRAAQGRLGDTVDDEPRRLPRRWPGALAVAASAVAAALVWFRAEPRFVQAPVPLARDSVPPIEVSTSMPSTVVAPPPSSVEADTGGPCRSFRQEASVRHESAAHRKPSGVTRERSVPVVEAPDRADIDTRVGVLADGRRFRTTLE